MKEEITTNFVSTPCPCSGTFQHTEDCPDNLKNQVTTVASTGSLKVAILAVACAKASSIEPSKECCSMPMCLHAPDCPIRKEFIEAMEAEKATKERIPLDDVLEEYGMLLSLDQQILEELKDPGRFETAEEVDEFFADALKRVRKDAHLKAIDMIQAKIDRADNPSLTAGLMYALTVLERFNTTD